MAFETAIIPHLLGPVGGLVALSWAIGAYIGYNFAMKSLKEKVSFLENLIKMADESCETRIKHLDERYSSEIETLRSLINSQSYQIKYLQGAVSTEKDKKDISQ